MRSANGFQVTVLICHATAATTNNAALVSPVWSRPFLQLLTGPKRKPNPASLNPPTWSVEKHAYIYFTWICLLSYWTKMTQISGWSEELGPPPFLEENYRFSVHVLEEKWAFRGKENS